MEGGAEPVSLMVKEDPLSFLSTEYFSSHHEEFKFSTAACISSHGPDVKLLLPHVSQKMSMIVVWITKVNHWPR